MNLRNVLRTYSLLRQLTDDESALLETLRTMNDSERELLVEVLSPQKSSSKKSSSKSAGKGAKSKRASGMQAQLNTRLAGQERRRQPMALCSYVSDDGDDPTQCGESESSGIHDVAMGYRNYHPFQPPASTAERSSSANGGAGSIETDLGGARLDEIRAASGE